MALKGNIRSFRYSDRVAEILEQQEGRSLNEKFENLVLYCFESVPRIKKDIAHYQEAIEGKRMAYQNICTQLQQVSSLIQTLRLLERYGQQAAEQAKTVVGRMGDHE